MGANVTRARVRSGGETLSFEGQLDDSCNIRVVERCVHDVGNSVSTRAVRNACCLNTPRGTDKSLRTTIVLSSGAPRLTARLASFNQGRPEAAADRAPLSTR
jgi:hypothetical protein